MDKNIRLLRMTDYIMEHKEVTVQTLAEVFQVSEMTVRRDLDIVERSHLIRRTHGGAIMSSVIYKERDFNL